MTLHAAPMLFTGAELRSDWPFGTLAPSGYDLIMADPPWLFELYSAKGEEKSAQAQYACMDIERIARLPVAELAAPDCVLWLWATSPLLPRQIAIAERWGFTFKTSGVWVKMTVNGKVGFGTGYILRSAHEPFVIATRGEPKCARDVRSVVMGQVREHSAKPDAAYAAAERLLPQARRVELFSRRSRPGWESWGDQLGVLDHVV